MADLTQFLVGMKPEQREKLLLDLRAKAGQLQGPDLEGLLSEYTRGQSAIGQLPALLGGQETPAGRFTGAVGDTLAGYGDMAKGAMHSAGKVVAPLFKPTFSTISDAVSPAFTSDQEREAEQQRRLAALRPPVEPAGLGAPPSTEGLARELSEPSAAGAVPPYASNPLLSQMLKPGGEPKRFDAPVPEAAPAEAEPMSEEERLRKMRALQSIADAGRGATFQTEADIMLGLPAWQPQTPRPLTGEIAGQEAKMARAADEESKTRQQQLKAASQLDYLKTQTDSAKDLARIKAASVDPKAAVNKELAEQSKSLNTSTSIRSLKEAARKGQMIREKLAAGGLEAYTAAIQLARGSGEVGTMTDKDIDRWNSRPGLQGVFDKGYKLVASDMSPELKQALMDAADRLENISRQGLKEEYEDRARRVKYLHQDIDPEYIDRFFTPPTTTAPEGKMYRVVKDGKTVGKATEEQARQYHAAGGYEIYEVN